jgi:hypothetical protein
MTTDEFNARYTLLKPIAHGKSRSFTAQEVGSGRAVMVHFLTEDRHPPGSAIAGLVERLPAPHRAQVLKILTVNLSTAVVTEPLDAFDSFDAWLQSRLAEIPAPPPAPAPVARPPETGEFTSLFQPPVALPTPPAAPVPAPAPALPPRPAAAGKAPGGSFTELFQPPSTSLPTPAPAPAAPPPPARPARPPAPRAHETPAGGFTELFQAPPEQKSHPFPAPSPAAPPVEMRSIRLPKSEPASRPAAPLAPLAPPPIVAPPLPSPVLPAPLPLPRAGEPIVRLPQRDQLAAPAPLPGWSGESDYTRQLRPAPPPDPVAPVVPAAPPPDAAKKPEAPAGAEGSRSLVPILLVINILVIIATGLVLYFALKRR